MANQTSRGGMKQGSRKEPGGKKHQGVRTGSSARKKDRTNPEPRQKIVPDATSKQAKAAQRD